MDGGRNSAIIAEKSSNPDRYKIYPGEPGCNVVTEFRNGEPIIKPIEPYGSPVPPSPLIPALAQAESREITPTLSNETACYRASLIEAFNSQANEKGRPKSEIVSRFLRVYNSGLFLPAIHKELGSISRSTLYSWLKAFREGGLDDLTPENGRKGITKITDTEKNMLLTILLHQNRIKIGSAIRHMKEFLSVKDIPSPSGLRTLRRYADQFKREHFDLWVFAWEGEKALGAKVIPYNERNREMLQVGEGLVADGHRFNFQVVNPFSGKPCRATEVLFFDWRSGYPLGWEIAIEENVQCISSAFRNAVLTLGKSPKFVQIDNGKAFNAEIFTSDVDLADTEIVGMFARCKVKLHLTMPYNAKAKIVER